MRFRDLIIPVVLGVSTVYAGSSLDNQIYAQKEKQLQEKKQSTPFKMAEEYHIKGEFDDAKNWYSMVVRDFPDTKEAAESSFRRFVIECIEIRILIRDTSSELEKAVAYLNEANQYYSDFKYVVMKKAVYHKSMSDKLYASVLKIVEEQFLNDFPNLKGYLKEDINAWMIPGIPVNEADVAQLYEKLELNDKKKIVNKFGYNIVVGDVSTAGKADMLKVRFEGGVILYNYSEKTTEAGKKELEDIIRETEDDPYNKIGYKAKEELKKRQLWKVFK